MITRKSSCTLGAFIAGVILASATLPSLAASACKGLQEQACGKTAECSWVDPYTRKDGVQVAGHCRTKPAKKDSQDVDQ